MKTIINFLKKLFKKKGSVNDHQEKQFISLVNEYAEASRWLDDVYDKHHSGIYDPDFENC